MKPSELKKFIQENKVVSLMDIMVHFEVEPAIIKQQLQQLLDKNLIKKIEAPQGKCAACQACGPMKFELYEWVE